MGIKIGDIEVANEIVELHYQLARTQLILDKLLNKVTGLSIIISPDDIKEADSKALEIVRKKFPTMDIKAKHYSG